MKTRQGDFMKDLEWIRTGVFAHRGLHDDEIPENSMNAFKEAIKYGYDIELDIRITKDNQLVVIHDKNLKRLCGINKNIHTLIYEEIKSLNLKETNQKISLLKDVLSEIPIKTKLLLELKKSRKDKKFVKEFIKLMENFDHIYAVHSFNPSILRHFKKLQPQIIRGHIIKSKPTNNIFINYVISRLPLYQYLRPDFINHRFEDLPNDKMDKLKNKGIMIISYTVRTQKDLDFIKKRYDNAVFEGFRPKK